MADKYVLHHPSEKLYLLVPPFAKSIRKTGGGFGGRKESGQLRFGGRDRPFKKPIVEILKNRDRARGPMITKSHIDREKPEKRYEPPRYLSGDSLYSSKTRCTRSLSRSRIMEYKKEKHHQMSKDRSQSRSNRRRSRSVSLERSDNEKIKLHKSSLKHSRSRSRECERKVNKSDYEESEIRHRSKKKKHKKEKRHKKKKRVSHSPLGSKASDGKDYKKDKSDSP
ncbi:uncharacterized protein LOC136025945 [Artemia franciscana]|uniref:uncharacterized protein LOC136025945 n=1 Tax=Artemia franciscana TaxID=6661 RepID=UPI0032DBB880